MLKNPRKIRRGTTFHDTGWKLLAQTPSFNAYANTDRRTAVVIDNRTGKVAECYTGRDYITDAIKTAHRWNILNA